MNPNLFATVPDAIIALQEGKMLIVVDHHDRENEGDFILPAVNITAEKVNFLLNFGKGLICAPMELSWAQKLDLPLMVSKSEDSHSTAFTISVDAAHGISTGISATDRAKTLKALAHPSAVASHFVKPGHIFPLIAKKGGVLERPGHTEASVDLCKMAGFPPVAVICEILKADGECARVHELIPLAQNWDIPILSIDDIIAYKKATKGTGI